MFLAGMGVPANPPRESPEIKAQIEGVKRAAKERQVSEGKKAGRGFREIKSRSWGLATPAQWTCHPGRMAFGRVWSVCVVYWMHPAVPEGGLDFQGPCIQS